MPMALALYWPGITRAGIIAGMLGGCITHLALYIAGYIIHQEFKVYSFLNIQPFLWDIFGSTMFAVLISKVTKPLEGNLIQKFFGKTN